MQIIEVDTHKALREFVKFPYRLYRDNPHYVPGIIRDEMMNFNPRKNPAYGFCEAKLFLAVENSEVVGRVAAIINHKAIEKFKDQRGRFGYIDAIDDFEVFRALMEAVEEYLRSKGIEIIQGPLGFTDLDEEGMLIDGFDETGTMTTLYNHAYYPEYVQRLGYTLDVTWYEYEISIPDRVDPRLETLGEHLKKKYHLRVLEARGTRDFLPYIEDIFRLINVCYRDLYNITEISEDQMVYYKNKFFSLVQPDFIRLILDERDSLVAFGIGFPSLVKPLQKNRGRLFPLGLFRILRAFKVNDRVELALIAVDPIFQGKGIPAIIFTEFMKSFVKNHIRYGDLNPQLEDNHKVRNHWNKFEHRQHKKRASYKKLL
ncbi:MAG: hypothetical protein AVO33_02545 [delta proteobacterium ML8_F1]|nr:MAG: hypothetical protein AVO33_02545 [delta proteobacterium ML8_F1]